MAIGVALAISILGSIVAYQLSIGKSKKRKLITWGVTTMIVIAPFLSFAIGLTVAFIVQNGWAALLMLYLFPIIFLVGLVMVLAAVFKEKERETV
ncbi:hypothetical protein [Domibacillus robiginosus]|uniref:hypothetical protein n=1 Tax=Domibacillus robiginosus TaxID=1071054 RepID=UPI00067D7BC5|nr:hypothetical protein [Domibacillus robiginosus]